MKCVAAARAVFFAVVMACPLAARASLAAYDVVLTVLGVKVFTPCSEPVVPGASFGCVSLGQSFRGSFSVDSSILAVDGINQTASIYDFSLPFGALTYSTGPDNDALAGFRNGLGFSSSPGFVINGGQVVGLYGGIFGFGDIPFIDLYGYGPDLETDQFRAYDGRTVVTGTVAISSAAPEPEAYAMFLAGLALIGVARYRKARRRDKPLLPGQ